MSKRLVIVESPAKAKTIAGFLGEGYEVVASFGHVRDLPERSDDIPEAMRKLPWAKLGVNVDDNFEPLYVVPKDKKVRVDALKSAAKDASELLLATDEDREGESISWHVLQLLKPKKGVPVRRVVFHEVTPEAIRAAVASPREIDDDLVRAQETRRILDRLFGYTLSPLLWRKVAKGLSAGRVQSVAVRLIVLRERERSSFREAEYSGVSADIAVAAGNIAARLAKIDGRSLADGASFSPGGELLSKPDYWLKRDEASGLAERLRATPDWTVTDVETKPGRENPPQPFLTSSLQQEGVRKLGMNARQVMRVAQQLYEGIDVGGERVGLITYMRTDSLSLSERALSEARAVITRLYGREYIPDSPNRYKTKAKGAQEAHEAIRPTDLARMPKEMQSHLDRDQAALYDLIWKRTIACQMKPAEVERTKVEIETSDSGRKLTFAASGKRIVFPGFLRAYVEGSDDPEAELDDRERILPEAVLGELGQPISVDATEHTTKPPARYTEASLVKTLEQEGVGRPSTYASIIGTIQDRGYVFTRSKELVPTWTAFAVTGLLEDHFESLVDIGFTAKMETELDEIAEGKRNGRAHLQLFFRGSDSAPGLEREVAERQGEIPFPFMPLGEDVHVRIGRNGPFLQRGDGGPGNTASVPEEVPPADLTYAAAIELLDKKAAGPSAVGVDPSTGRCVFHKTGRFGDYLELEAVEGEAPKRVSVPPGVSPSSLTDDDVALLMRFPRELGPGPGGDPVMVQIGRYGPYVTSGTQKGSFTDWRQAASATLEEAVAVLGASRSSRGAPEPLRELGETPGVDGAIRVMSGRFGPYVTNGTVNATLPKAIEPQKVTLEQAADLIKAKAAAGPSKKPFRKKRARS